MSSAKAVLKSVQFSEPIRALRLSLNESQEGMSRRLGMSLRGYVRYERGESIPSGEMLVKLQSMGLRIAAADGGNLDSLNAQLHAALDIILERAPESIRAKVAENLTRYAGIYGAR